MIALKHILVPTDFSEASLAAVKYGVAFARTFHATLHLLHVELRHDLEVAIASQHAMDTLVGAAPMPPVSIGDPELVREAAREQLGKMLAGHDVHDITVEYVLRASGLGGPYVEIVRYAHEVDIDLIILGAHGHGFVKHMLMGSVAEKVVRHAPCPVLTVRHPEHEFVLPDDGASSTKP